MLNDIRYSLRLLVRRPLFTLGAAGTLALAVGGTIAIFSIVYGLLFRPLIVPQADRLLIVQQVDAREPQLRGSVDFPQFTDWQTSVAAFSSLAAVSSLRFDLVGGGPAERIDGQAVTWNFFETLAVPPEIGRTFNPGDTGGHPCVISDRLWRGRFGGDPRVLGREISAQDDSFFIVGVMPPGFERWRGLSDLWVPIEAVPERRPIRRGYLIYDAVGRLKPEASAGEAAAEATASVRRIESGWEDRFGAAGVPLRNDVVRPESRRLLALFAVAVALVWIIACANVGSLILARTTDRLPEFAVRAALGASAGRLLRQVLAESALVAALGTAAGWVLANWALRATIAFGPGLAGRSDLVRLDAAAAVAAIATAVATTLAVGVVPTLFLSRRHRRLLADTSGRGTVTTGSHRLHDGLVMIEIAVAVVVLASAALIVRSLLNLRHVELGFESSSILTLGVSMPSRLTSAEWAPQIAALLDELRTIPGVRHAAVTADLLVPNSGRTSSLTLESGPHYLNGEVSQRAWTPGRHLVSPDYFGAFGIPIVRGRGFLRSDDANGRPVTIISAKMARLHWPGEDPIGQRISNGLRRRDGSIHDPWLTIVGIAADARYGGPAVAIKPEMYVPMAQSPTSNVFVVLKTASDPKQLIPVVRQRIASVDAAIPVFDISSMDDRVADAIAETRARSTVVSAFALVALVLTATGLFAAMAGRVARRRRELAVRVALGAEPARLVRLVLGHAVRLLVPSAIAGLGLAVGGTRLMASQLFGLSPGDPVTLAAAATALVGIASSRPTFPHAAPRGSIP